MATVPWQIGDGTTQAFIITPEACAKMAKAAKRPLVIVGGQSMDENGGINIKDYVAPLAKALKAPVVVSPGLFKDFKSLDRVKVVCMGIEDLVNRLKEKGWEGLDGKGNYDTVLFISGIYYFQSLMLSTLKHFAPHIKTVSMDRFFHPNAGFSFGNMSEEKWAQGLKSMIDALTPRSKVK